MTWPPNDEMAAARRQRMKARIERRTWYCKFCVKTAHLPAVVKLPACPGCGRMLTLVERRSGAAAEESRRDSPESRREAS